MKKTLQSSNKYEDYTEQTQSKKTLKSGKIYEASTEQVQSKKTLQSENNVASTAEVSAKNITNLHCCGELIQIELNRDCETCGQRLSERGLEYSLVGSDVKTLFPSITS